MSTVQAVYMMAFIPEEKLESQMLMAVCQMAADRLALRDQPFAKRMSTLPKGTRLNFTHRPYVATMYTPESMERHMQMWLETNSLPAELRLGENFFRHALRDPKGRENYFFYYFDLQ